MVKTAQKKSYETLNHYFYPLFSWCIPLVIGVIILLLSLKLGVWKLWPLMLLFLGISLVAISKIIVKMRVEYTKNKKKYGKEYSRFVWKNLGGTDFYGIIALLLLVILLISVLVVM